MALIQTIADINRLEDSYRGYNGVSLTNFTNTSEPAIAEGSTIEIGGSILKAVAEEAITGWSGIGDGVDVYIYIDAAGAATFSTTAPTWSDILQGYYNGTDRAVAGVYKTSAAVYLNKKILSTVTSSGEFTGTITASASKNIPGWLYCDGSTINSTTVPIHARLVGLLKAEAGADAAHPYYHADGDKAVLPNFQGAVLRGIDVAATRDKDGLRKSGNYQADGNKSHSHTTYRIEGLSGGSLAAFDTVDNYFGDRAVDGTGAILNEGNTEATMKNVAVYYLIKY